MDTRTFRVYKLCPVNNPSSGTSASSNLTQTQPAQYGGSSKVEESLASIKDSLQSLIELNSVNLGFHQRKAMVYLKELDTIANDETLPLAARNKLYKETHDKYLIHSAKAKEEELQKKVEMPDADVTPYTGARKRTEDIIQPLTKGNGEKAGDILNSLKSSGELTWNENGEIVDPESSTVYPDTDITKILKYDLATNKNKMSKPEGYDKFKKAANKSIRYLKGINRARQRLARDRLVNIMQPALEEEEEEEVATPAQTPGRKRKATKRRNRIANELAFTPAKQKGSGLKLSKALSQFF